MEMTSVAPEEYLGGGQICAHRCTNFFFFWTILCLDTRQPGSVFKQLDTWQSEIIIDRNSMV